MKEESESELINHFFEIIIESYDKQLPTLFNTDGEPIQFSKACFKLSIPPIEALFKLLPLTLSKDPAEFLEDAERNSSGVVVRIEFPWLKKGNKQHKHWDNTVMGNVLIEENKLILETNSEKRNQQGKKLLGKYLGNDIHFQNTLIESPEQMLKSKPTQNGIQMDTKLLELPEVQEQLKQMAKAHWKNWFNEPIPALNNQTPREASRTEKGRELLEALLLQYEQNDLKNSEQMNFFKADINYLKSELKLKSVL